MFNNPFSMVVAIVAIVMVANVLKARYGRRHGARFEGADSAETSALRQEVSALKERIAVLERIATDNHQAIALDKEIARLRDQ